MKTETKFLPGISIFLFGAIAYLLMIWITPFGSGVSPDSTVYIGGAQSLLAGNGFSFKNSPITHFPPLYSLFLVIGGILDSDFVQIARHLNGLILGVNAGLIAFAVYQVTKPGLAASIAATLFFVASAPLLEVHAWAWSEPLFIALLLACVLLLSRQIVQPGTLHFAASAIALALAMLTRYAGLAFIPPALFMLIIGSREKSLRKRLRTALFWFILAMTPLGIWLIRNIWVGGTPTSRSLVAVPVSAYDYGYRIYNMLHSFFIPVSLPAGVRPLITVVFIIGSGMLFVLLFRRLRGFSGWRRMDVVLSGTSLLFVGSYIIFLLISITIFDTSTPVDWRIFSPALTMLILGLFSGAWVISRAVVNPSGVYRVFLLLVLIPILLKTPDAIDSARSIRESGLGYTSVKWQQSESITFVRSVPDDVKIYSNGSDVIEFLTGRNALSLPVKTNPITSSENKDFKDEMEEMCRVIRENTALLVYLGNIVWRHYLPTEGDIEETCNLPVIRVFDDGIVYGERR